MNASPLVLLASAALVGSACVSTKRATSAGARPGRVLLAGAGFFVLLGALRSLLAVPTLVHDNFHSIELVDTTLGYLDDNPRLRAYGPVSFAVLGTLARAFGGDLDALFGINLALNWLALGLSAVYFGRRYGGARVALGVLCLGFAFPPVLKVGASEDAHGLAVLLSMGALLALDAFVASRRASDALCAVLATALALYTRQTVLPLLAALPLVVGATHGRAAMTRPPVLVVLGAVLGLCALRLGPVLGDPTNQNSLAMLRRVAATPELLLPMLRTHPLVDVSRSAALVLPLLSIGAVGVARSRGGWALLGTLAALFALTLAFFRDNPGTGFAMRLPLTLPALGVAAVGLVLLLDAALARASPATRRRATAAVVVGTAVSPLALPGAADLAYESVEGQEYRYVESVASQLPADVRFVRLALPPAAPPVVVPLAPLGAGGRTVVLVPPGIADPSPAPSYFLEGVACRAYSAFELCHTSPREVLARPAWLAELARALLDGRLPGRCTAPPGTRPECARLTRGARRAAPEATLTPHTVAPFAYFSSESPVPLRLWQLPAPSR